MKVFFDTNVILDVLLLRIEFLEHSSKIWRLAEEGRIRGFVSANSITDVYYICRKLYGKETGKSMIRDVLKVFEISPLNHEIINKAIDADFEDFEDAVQCLSADAVGAEAIVTRDARDFETSHVEALSPEQFIIQHG